MGCPPTRHHDHAADAVDHVRYFGRHAQRHDGDDGHLDGMMMMMVMMMVMMMIMVAMMMMMMRMMVMMMRSFQDEDGDGNAQKPKTQGRSQFCMKVS